MPRQSGIAVENNFKKGLITEATGLNFPENACTETYNCVFNTDGSVERRLGFDFEADHDIKEIDRTNKAITSYMWRNVAGDGDITLVVMQVGDTLYFYRTGYTAISRGELPGTVDLTQFKTVGSPNIEIQECQYSSGGDYLIVTHPYCEPFSVMFDKINGTFTSEVISMKVRDFEGEINDTYAIDQRPNTSKTGMLIEHYYNLKNQGWTEENLNTWDAARADMPSNADIMWRFKDTNGNFDVSMVPKVVSGNTLAPRGHYIYNAWYMDRETTSGISGGLTVTSSGYFRPTTSAWMGGRVFYAGVNTPGYNTNIYFSPIIERKTQLGQAHQDNDPTSEEFSDLLPSDGGVITIMEVGTIYKLVTILGSLLVFANNGVWAITGSNSLGFKADDYTIQKISTIGCISHSPFVDVSGLPVWWNADGIYSIAFENNLTPVVKPMSMETIRGFYDFIPQASKLNAKGFHNDVDGLITWVYKLDPALDITSRYSYNAALSYNTTTGAFYPWTFSSDHPVQINGIVVLEGSSGTLVEYEVVDDNGDFVVDDNGNQVVEYNLESLTKDQVPTFKFIVSYPDNGSYQFTFAENNNEELKDWITYDLEGIDYSSYFITGYKTRGNAMNRQQPCYITVYSRTDIPVQFHFQAIWDYALNPQNTNRWSTKALIIHDDTNYGYASRRVKVRGHGKTMQYKVTSISNSPFKVIGWAALDTVNQLP